MYEYMRGLHQQFLKEPDFPELRQELHELHQELTEEKLKDERRKLLKLVDLGAELRDEIFFPLICPTNIISGADTCCPACEEFQCFL